MPYAVRLNPDPPAGSTGSDGLKFRMVTSGIRAGALLCRSGTAWVTDRMQTRVCRRRPLPGLEEHDAMNVRSTRTTGAPLSRIALMTVDHHGQGVPVFVTALDMTVDHALDAKPSVSASHLQRGPAYRHSSRPRPRPADLIPHHADCGQWVWGNFLCRPDSTPLSCCPWRPRHCPRAPKWCFGAMCRPPTSQY